MVVVIGDLKVSISVSGSCQQSGQQTERRSGETEEDQGSPWSQALLGVRAVSKSLAIGTTLTTSSVRVQECSKFGRLLECACILTRYSF